MYAIGAAAAIVTAANGGANGGMAVGVNEAVTGRQFISGQDDNVLLSIVRTHAGHATPFCHWNRKVLDIHYKQFVLGPHIGLVTISPTHNTWRNLRKLSLFSAMVRVWMEYWAVSIPKLMGLLFALTVTQWGQCLRGRKKNQLPMYSVYVSFRKHIRTCTPANLSVVARAVSKSRAKKGLVNSRSITRL